MKQTPLKTSFINNKIIQSCLFSLILILSFSAAGCKRVPERIVIDIPKETSARWETIIGELPLPEIFTMVLPTDEDKTIPEIRIIQYHSHQIPVEGNSFLLDYEYLIPVTDFWNPISTISKDDLSDYQLLPPDRIMLPKKGLAVDGLYPEDKGYPLYGETRISLIIPEEYNKENGRILMEWFNNIRDVYAENSPVPPGISWISGVGDLMLQRGVEDILMYKRNGIETVFGDTEEILKTSDLTLGNLEGSVTYTNIKTPKSYNFRFNPKVLPILKTIGFDYFSITTNHIYDYGETGFTDTLSYLEKAGIPVSGAGLTKKEAARFTEFSLNSNRVRILSMGAYPREGNGWDGRTMAQISDTRPGILFEGKEAFEAVSKMTSPESFDILMIHGGVEWTYTPGEEQKRIYRSYIDAGVDLILGSHPHVLQGMEVWNKGLIAYSLGNFIFPGMDSMPYAEDSIILTAGIINNKIVYLKSVPVKINNRSISVDRSGKIIERFTSLTKKLIKY